MSWTTLDSSEAIERLMDEFAGFHDACLREISVATETFVAANRAMSCPPHLDTSVLVFLQSQAARVPAIEIRCLEVTRLRLTPSDDGCDSIVASGEVCRNDSWYRLALNFLGGPLQAPPVNNFFVLPGPPNGSLPTPPGSVNEPDIDVVARSMAWRPVLDGWGPTLRYRS